MFKEHLILKRHQSVPFFSLNKVFTKSNSIAQKILLNELFLITKVPWAPLFMASSVKTAKQGDCQV